MGKSINLHSKEEKIWEKVLIYIVMLIIGSPIIGKFFPNSLLAGLILISLSLTFSFLILPLLPFWKKIKTPYELD